MGQILRNSKISPRIRGGIASGRGAFSMKSMRKKISLLWWLLLIEAVLTNPFKNKNGRGLWRFEVSSNHSSLITKCLNRDYAKALDEMRKDAWKNHRQGESAQLRDL